jgi:putative selenium metabolism hydrolase
MASPKDVLKKAQEYEKDVAQFLRDIVAIPSYSGQEKAVVDRISAEMKKVGFDEVKVDGLGNIFGRIGNGKTKIVMDAHIDVVGVGDPTQWKYDPFKGKMENGIIYGRGAGDQKAGMASMVYA